MSRFYYPKEDGFQKSANKAKTRAGAIKNISKNRIKGHFPIGQESP